jgi:hypothetical protein
MCIITNSMHCLFLVYLTKIPLHGSGINSPLSGGKVYVANGTSKMTVSEQFRASTAHHQEVRCMYVANDTAKMAVSEPAG